MAVAASPEARVESPMAVAAPPEAFGVKFTFNCARDKGGAVDGNVAGVRVFELQCLDGGDDGGQIGRLGLGLGIRLSHLRRCRLLHAFAAIRLFNVPSILVVIGAGGGREGHGGREGAGAGGRGGGHGDGGDRRGREGEGGRGRARATWTGAPTGVVHVAPRPSRRGRPRGAPLASMASMSEPLTSLSSGCKCRFDCAKEHHVAHVRYRAIRTDASDQRSTRSR